jgi:uncharacterized membrane protein
METTNTETDSPRQEQRKQRRVNVGPAERQASMIGGAALALSGLTSLSKRRYLPGLAMMVAGGMFLYRGKTGHCDLYQSLGVDTIHTSSTGLRLEKLLTINRPPQQVYEFWRNLENLPRFMQHLKSVQVTGEKTSHWKAKGPGGVSAEWDAEMMDDYPGQQISWHSVGSAALPNKGRVEFKEAPGERGTEVKVSIDYYPPGGAAGRAAARLAQLLTAQQLEEDLKRLKQILETGEIATAERSAAKNTAFTQAQGTGNEEAI